MKKVIISGNHENPAEVRHTLRRILTGLAIILDKPTFYPAMNTNLGTLAVCLLEEMQEEFFVPIRYEDLDPEDEEKALENAYLLIHNLNEDELSRLSEKYPDLELISAGQELV